MNLMTKILIALCVASVTLLEFGPELLRKICNVLKITNLLKKKL